LWEEESGGIVLFVFGRAGFQGLCAVGSHFCSRREGKGREGKRREGYGGSARTDISAEAEAATERALRGNRIPCFLPHYCFLPFGVCCSAQEAAEETATGFGVWI
jgi:hypothetical protein